MGSPTSIQFYPTLRCNQKCSFCFNQGISDTALLGEMGRKKALLLADILTDSGITEVDVLGGEPLLVPWLKDFIVRLTDTGITVNISTNGTLMKALGALAEIRTSLLNIGFSLHGFSEKHRRLTGTGSFNKTINGIIFMIEKGLNPITKSTLTRDNADEIYSLVAFLNTIGVKRYYLMHEDIMGRPGGNTFSFPEFWKTYSGIRKDFTDNIHVGYVSASGFRADARGNDSRCDAGSEKLAIFPDGSVYPCNLFAGFPEFNLGNIFHTRVNTILSHHMLESLQKRKDKNQCTHDTCRFHSECRGGCPAHTYQYNGTLDSVDPRCMLIKKML